MKIIDYGECPICGNLDELVEAYDEVERKQYKACEMCVADGLVMLTKVVRSEMA